MVSPREQAAILAAKESTAKRGQKIDSNVSNETFQPVKTVLTAWSRFDPRVPRVVKGR